MCSFRFSPLMPTKKPKMKEAGCSILAAWGLDMSKLKKGKRMEILLFILVGIFTYCVIKVNNEE